MSRTIEPVTISILCRLLADRRKTCRVASSYRGFVQATVASLTRVPRDYSSAITTLNPVIPLFSQPFLLLRVKYKDGGIIERVGV